jgi:hypothetical protein
MAAGHAIPRARNGDEVCAEKRERKTGQEEGGMGVLCTKCRAFNSNTCLDRAMVFF